MKTERNVEVDLRNLIAPSQDQLEQTALVVAKDLVLDSLMGRCFTSHPDGGFTFNEKVVNEPRFPLEAYKLSNSPIKRFKTIRVDGTQRLFEEKPYVTDGATARIKFDYVEAKGLIQFTVFKTRGEIKSDYTFKVSETECGLMMTVFISFEQDDYEWEMIGVQSLRNALVNQKLQER